MKEAAAAETPPDYKALGPAAAHFYSIIVEHLSKMQPSADTMLHIERVKKIAEKLEDETTGLEKAIEQAGTILKRKAHGTTSKLVMKLNLPAEDSQSILFLLGKTGLKVYIGKPPRGGLARTLQAQLND